MVKLRTDYITKILPEELDTLTSDDKLYVDGKHGEYRFDEQMIIQKDDDSISFVYDDMVYILGFDDIKMYKVNEKSRYDYLINGEVSGFENFMLGLLFGVILMVILSCISGG